MESLEQEEDIEEKADEEINKILYQITDGTVERLTIGKLGELTTVTTELVFTSADFSLLLRSRIWTRCKIG